MIYNPEVTFAPADFIQMSSGNIISRKATIANAQQLEVPNGKCFIDCDTNIFSNLAVIQLNRYCYLAKSVTLKPCQNLKDPTQYIKMTVGSHTYIGEGSIIEAARIGNGCVIGKNCVISQRCILKDFVMVLDGSVILPDMVLPPFAIVGGNPARIVGEQPESTSTLAPLAAVERYKALRPAANNLS